jgi:nicotinamidase-related amidase
MPHDLGYDEKTAMIVVDVQNDFADPAGSLPSRTERRVLRVHDAGSGDRTGAANRA